MFGKSHVKKDGPAVVMDIPAYRKLPLPRAFELSLRASVVSALYDCTTLRDLQSRITSSV